MFSKMLEHPWQTNTLVWSSFLCWLLRSTSLHWVSVKCLGDLNETLFVNSCLCDKMISPKLTVNEESTSAATCNNLVLMSLKLKAKWYLTIPPLPIRFDFVTTTVWQATRQNKDQILSRLYCPAKHKNCIQQKQTKYNLTFLQSL